MIVSLILLSPLFLWHVVIYMPEEHYCYVSYADFRGIFWAIFSVYGIPIRCILMMYVRITKFIRKQGNNQTLIVKRRQERDLIAMKRILLTVGLLTLIGVPATFFLMKLILTGEIHPLALRIVFVAASMSMAGLSVVVFFFIPQLKSIVLKNRT
jgi:hypothetical protein